MNVFFIGGKFHCAKKSARDNSSKKERDG